MKKMLIVAALMVGGYAAQAQINGPIGGSSDCWKFGKFISATVDQYGVVEIICDKPTPQMECCIWYRKSPEHLIPNVSGGEAFMFRNPIDLGKRVIGEIIEN